jgi:subtilisin-like proprotein convertase family protein
MIKGNRSRHTSISSSHRFRRVIRIEGLLVVTAILAIVAAQLAPQTSAQRVKTTPASKLGLSESAKRQIAELRAEKAARTPAQQKISSKLLYEIKMSGGEAITASVGTLKRTIAVDSQGMTPVLISFSDKKAVLNGLEGLRTKYGQGKKPEIISEGDNPLLVNVRLDQIEEIASWDNVLAIRPQVKRIHAEKPGLAAKLPPMGVFGARAFLDPLWAFPRSVSDIRLGAENDARGVLKQQLASYIEAARAGRGAVIESTLATNVSQGDKTHKADVSRTNVGATGVGIKVGVISDGVDSLASLQAIGDLPSNVTVLAGQAGSGDEGSAMLEIVHDLAPKAQLYFATADPTETQFANNILALQAAGCNVIVDDIIYLDESPFEDGPVAQAVNTVTAAGTLYFSSAGNEGNKSDGTSGTWEGDFLESAAADPAALTAVGATHLHNFGDGGNSISITASGDAILIWAEHFTAATGSASTDFDLYEVNSGLTSVVDFSNDRQNGVGGNDFPIEFISAAGAGDRLVIDRFAAGSTSSVPMMNLINFRGVLSSSLSTPGATRGHSAATDAFSVAATPAAAAIGGGQPSGPYPNPFTSANVSETFSSDGPRRIILNPNGTEITPGNRTNTGGVVRQKPDITAADGVAAAAVDFNPFFGTSAAAPHAAAIAAMLRSGNPALTPAQIRTFLTTTAIDIETGGTDRTTGVGIVMADAAITAAGIAPRAFPESGAATVTSEACQPANQRLDPNAFQTVSFCITNSGPTATSLMGTLQATGGVSNIVGNPQNYGAVANGATVCRPFSFRSSGTCGGKVTATVNFTDGAVNVGSTEYVMRLGTQTTGAPLTFTFSGPAVPIPDGTAAGPGAPANAVLNVSGVTGLINDINFSINGTACSNVAGSTTVGLDHTFVSDLTLTLKSPAGTTVPVIVQTDGSGNNFCQTILDDESAGASIQTVTSGSAPFTGSFKPAASLTAFDQQDPNGNWTLIAQDFFSGDTGSIRNFSIIITPETSSCASCFTAAGVSVGGRVLTPEGRGLSNATVLLTDTDGTVWQTTTKARGNFVFDDVPAGQTYVISVISKQYSFEPQFISPTDSVTGLLFRAG